MREEIQVQSATSETEILSLEDGYYTVKSNRLFQTSLLVYSKNRPILWRFTLPCCLVLTSFKLLQTHCSGYFFCRQ